MKALQLAERFLAGKHSTFLSRKQVNWLQDVITNCRFRGGLTVDVLFGWGPHCETVKVIDGKFALVASSGELWRWE